MKFGTNGQYAMDETAKKAFDIAKETAKTYHNSYIGTEHVMYGILSVDSFTAKVFAKNSLNPQKMITIFEDESDGDVDVEPVESSKVSDLPFSAYIKSTGLNSPIITADHVMLAILDYPSSVARETLYGLYNVDIQTFKRVLLKHLSGPSSSADNPFSSPLERRPSMFGTPFGHVFFPPQSNADYNSEPNGMRPSTGLPQALLDLGVDITQRARDKKLDPVIGREHEVERIIEILCRKTKNNPVLIGEPGVGKSAIIDGLAMAIVEDRVPRQLRNNIVYSLNIGSLMAGTKYRGMLEEKLKDAIEAIINNGNIIVFIDELHTLMQAGSKDGEVSPADILKPYLARGEMHTIGATTTDEYRKYIEADKAMERRFQPITVEPPTVEQTIEILKGLRQNYENFHKVKLSDEAIEAAAKLSDKYIADRFQPDKSIDLIDEAMSCAKVSSSVDSVDVTELTAELAEANKKMQEFAALKDYKKAAQFKEKAEKLAGEIRSRNLQDAAKQEKTSITITAENIADVVARWTKIPVTKLTESESERLRNMEDILHKRVIGQHKAVEAVAKAIRRARAGLKSDNRPIGSFLFLGPTGVGKTELTKALAEAMFDNENSIIRLDMSEFMESHSVSKLIGAPPGYVGFDDGGQLTEKVRRHPYSVVLFDEIEKAHPDVFNALLQILDDGRLTDSQGRTVSFKNTIIIMTSNAGATDAADRREIGFNAVGKKETDARDEVYMKALKSTFRPEFINRIDVICVFDKLTRDDVAKIAKIMLEKVEKSLKDRNISIVITQEALDWLIDKGYDAEYGARPLRRVIEQNVEDEIADNIIDGKISDNSTVRIDTDGEKILIKSV